MRLTSKLAVLTVAWAALAAGRADAGLIPTNVTISPDGGNYRWTYAVVVTTDVKVNPGDFFTIYDFGGLVGGPNGVIAGPSTIVAPPDWEITEAMTGPTPEGTNPADDPNVVNLTFTYKGTDPIIGQDGLGNFSAISIYGETTTSDFTSITHRQVDGRAEANITTTDVPVPGFDLEETPEPATLAMVGVGLPLLGLGRWLRRRRTR